MNLPPKYMDAMKQLLGKEQWEQYLTSFQEIRYGGLRINPLKCRPDSLKLPFSCMPVPWCEEGRLFMQEERPAKLPYYAAGLYYLQEPSAMAPGAFLPISEYDRVLDLCAAPGGKATQLGARLNHTGLLVANDVSAGRTKALLKNIELFGIRNAIVLSEQPERLAQRLPEFFDKILIDAPCSGEGMFRREPGMVKSWNDELVSFCKNQQRDLLLQASKMLRPGGMLLYSTCTFSTFENEQTIYEFLQSDNTFSLVPIEKQWGIEEGVPFNNESEFLKGCARFYPHKLRGEGHFLALLQKNDSQYNQHTIIYDLGDDIGPSEAYHSFSREVLKSPLEGIFKRYGDTLCLLPANTPDFKGLRVLRTGWQLGNFKNGRFEPAQALAMGLSREMVKNAVIFELADPRVMRYLKGESIEVDNMKNGWHVVFLEDYPLGFGKMQNGRLKNKYPPGWKWE